MDITSVDSNIIVENEEDKSISVQNKDIMVVNSEPEFEVTVQRKEYSIVGDGLYIPKRYEDAPQWIRDLIGTVTEESFNQKITELNSLTQTLNQLIVELDVAKNTYTQSIISSNDIDERINTAITTLNSSLANSDATIVELLNTKVTLNDASSIASDVISASINSGAINALTSSIETASVDRDSALANDISLVHSELSGDIEGNADAITSLNTSVTNINNTLTAQSVDITNLTTEVNNGTNTWASADSALENSLKTEISGESARVESKFAYNSIVNINGVYKKSGFGLTTNYTSGSGTQANPYVSEFWIDASRLKFTNSNQTGQVAPFTIDATGVTPQITFNGRVQFSNVDGYVAPDISGSISTNNDTFAQKLGYANYSAMVAAAASGKTIINAGYIGTNMVRADSIAADAISGKTISGGVVTGSEITGGSIYGAYIEGAIIKASFIDLSSTATLTNWQQYTPANYPSAYDANFAKNNDGTLLVDSAGYVRLMGNTNITIPARVSPTPYEFGLYAFNSYKNNNINRCITENITFYPATSQVFNFITVKAVADETNTSYASVDLTINGDAYKLYAHGGIYKTGADGWNYDYYIKKNGVILKSVSVGSVASSSKSITVYIGSMPIVLTVSAFMYYGLSLSCAVTSAGAIPTSYSVTGVNFSGGSPLVITAINYKSQSPTTSVSLPAIRIG